MARRENKQEDTMIEGADKTPVVVISTEDAAGMTGAELSSAERRQALISSALSTTLKFATIGFPDYHCDNSVCGMKHLAKLTIDAQLWLPKLANLSTNSTDSIVIIKGSGRIDRNMLPIVEVDCDKKVS